MIETHVERYLQICRLMLKPQGRNRGADPSFYNLYLHVVGTRKMMFTASSMITKTNSTPRKLLWSKLSSEGPRAKLKLQLSEDGHI